MLPSTSSTHTPLARSATSLNDGRGYEGVTNFASASTMALPFGPGRAVLISGLFGAMAVDMESSSSFETLGRDTYRQCQNKRSDFEEERLIREEVSAANKWAKK